MPSFDVTFRVELDRKIIQINWLAESCDLRRPSICSFNPDPAEFEESLSRSKRSKTHVVIANRAAGEDFLERINREQESDDFDPKVCFKNYACFRIQKRIPLMPLFLESSVCSIGRSRDKIN